jgi:hypothetical protein
MKKWKKRLIPVVVVKLAPGRKLLTASAIQAAAPE